MIYKANILVVDDDKSVCQGVALVLKGEGYVVDTVFSGEEALARLEKKNYKYAIAIVDLMLPGMSGTELLEKIKKRNPNVTVIMITGYPSIKTAVNSVKLCAFDYIPKPFAPEELRSLVARALEERHSYEEAASKLHIQEERLVEISVPGETYCIPDHSWAKLEKDGNVRIGIHHNFVRAIKGIKSIEFPGKNEMRYQGEACVRIVDLHDKVHRMWAPVTGRVIAANERLDDDFSPVIDDPYGNGWLVLVEPLQLDDDLKRLTALTT